MSLLLEELANGDERLFCECNLISVNEVILHFLHEVSLVPNEKMVNELLLDLGCGRGCGHCLVDQHHLIKMITDHFA
ncbi:MAG: hypothetical protein QE271_06845 [Bacteriovoracaceae bacterium]|nr:hypothetical protein [Bacteriovoracaceae bacterium]